MLATVNSNTPSPTLTISSSGSSEEHISLSSNTREGLFGQFKLADVPKLHSIFFAVFDNTIGPKIVYQFPDPSQHPDPDVVNERFKSFSGVFIPKFELLNRLVKVNFHDYKIMGHPIGLEHVEYPRGQFLFNMCFVVPKLSTVDCMYEPLVQKVAEYLTELEQECRFLSNPESIVRLPDIMAQIFNGLNSNGECVLSVENTMTTMYLKLCPSYRGIEPPKVSLYMVPMFTRQLDFSKNLAMVSKMDVLSQKIIPYIDGVRCVKEIASEINIDPDLVSSCVRNLYFYECVNMVPLFLYSNTYVTTERLHDFYENDKEIEECLNFIRANGMSKEEGPVFSDVHRLYMSMRCGMTLREWCEEIHPERYGVDVRRMVQFGMHRRFVRKLSIYPVATVPAHGEAGRIYNLCDGTNALEDLAVIYSIPPDQLLDCLQESGKFEFISK